MRHIYSLILLVFISLAPAYGQQDAQFSQYMYNMLYYNPAYAGVDGVTTVTAFHRTQWAGWTPTVAADGDGGINTQVVSLNTPILRLRSGLGIHIVNDNIGPQTNTEAQASFAYQLGIGDAKLSLGARLGMYAQTLDFDRYRWVDEDDPLRQQGRETQVRPDLGLGVFVRHEEFYGGVSFNHLLEGQFDFGLDTLRNPLERHVTMIGAYEYEMNFKLKIIPSFLVKTDNFNTYSFDFGIIARYDETLWGGLSFRQSEAAIAMFGYSFFKDKSLSVGYSFDYVIQGQEAKQPTSHEIFLSYRLPLISASEKKIIRTPRFRK